MNTSYKVVGTWGAQKYTTELGEFATMEEAMDCANNWREAPKACGLHMDLIEVMRIKKSESTVYSAAHTAPRDPRTGPSGSREHGSDNQDTARHLEDILEELESRYQEEGLRPVGLVSDVDHAFASIIALRDVTTESIEALQEDIAEDRHRLLNVRRDVATDLMNTASNIRDLEGEVCTLKDDVLGYKEMVEELRSEMKVLRDEMMAMNYVLGHDDVPFNLFSHRSEEVGQTGAHKITKEQAEKFKAIQGAGDAWYNRK